MVINFFLVNCLLPVRLLLFSMAVVYHVNGYMAIALQGTTLNRAALHTGRTPLIRPFNGMSYSFNFISQISFTQKQKFLILNFFITFFA